MEQNSSSQIHTVELRPADEWLSWTDDPVRLRERVLKGLRESKPQHKPPGWAWWCLRSWVGGRVSASMLRDVLDGLIADGVIIEVWLHRGVVGPLKHRFVLVGAWGSINEEMAVGVRANQAVVEHLELVNTVGECNHNDVPRPGRFSKSWSWGIEANTHDIRRWSDELLGCPTSCDWYRKEASNMTVAIFERRRR